VVQLVAGHLAHRLKTGRESMENAAPAGRVYRMTWLFRGLGIVFLLISCFFAFGIGRRLLMDEAKPGLEKISVVVLLLAVGCVMTLHGFVSRLLFSADGVEQVTLLGRKNMPFASIRGRREYVARGSKGGSTRYLRLEANDSHAALEFGKQLYGFDAAFWEWFNALPDLDAIDKVKQKDSNFGLV
jgi:hypothetical protein